jgi:hypothetical protein
LPKAESRETWNGIVRPPFALSLLAAAAITAPGVAQTAPAPSTLSRLPAVAVHVVGVSSEAAAAGVDSADLRRRTERQLARAGFEVASPADLARRPDTPRLVVNLGMFRTRDATAVYSALLELVELVTVKRNGIDTHAVDWSEQLLGIAPVGESAEATRNAIAALVDLFVTQSRGATQANRS